MSRTVLFAAMISFSAIAIPAPAAFAQSAEDCEALLTEVNAEIDTLMESQQPGSEETATSARSMTDAAASARDEGDHARCMEQANAAKAAVDGVSK